MLQEDKEVFTTSCLLNRSMPLDVSYGVMFSVWNFCIVKHLISTGKGASCRQLLCFEDS